MTVFLVWRILAPPGGAPAHPAALVAVALAPASIMVSGFHGNTDGLMVCLVVLSVYFLTRRPRVLLAGFAMGMALNVKVLPLIFLPAIFLYLPDTRRRLRYFGALAATVLLGSLPYLAQDPVFIAKRVLGYGSIYGQWGLGRLLVSTAPFAALSLVYQQYGKYLALAAVVAAALVMNARPRRPSLFRQLGFTVFLFLSLAPGFGIQYLAWLVPWVAGLGLGATLLYCLASGLFQFFVYDFWSGGLPWFFADSDFVGPWRGVIVYYEILCWATVVALTSRYFVRHKESDSVG